MKILSVNQLYELDKITIKNQHLESLELMERAGMRIFDWIAQRFKPADQLFHIFCGVGNNGGDGLVVGRLLHQSGYRIEVYSVEFSENPSKDYLLNFGKLRRDNFEPKEIQDGEDFP